MFCKIQPEAVMGENLPTPERPTAGSKGYTLGSKKRRELFTCSFSGPSGQGKAAAFTKKRSNP